MRAAPALLVTVSRYEGWRVFQTFVVASTVAVLVCWLTGAAAAGVPKWTALPIAATAAVVAWRSSVRRAVRLQWDGRCWRMGSPTLADAAEMPAGELRVMLDLGGFLLLRFEAAAGGAAQWLPVQRLGSEAAWHALRCAVYSPRPSPASASVDVPPPPA